MTSEKDYSGILAEPLSPKDFAPDASLDEQYSALMGISERVSALFEHFDVDRDKPDAGMALALALARQHVPGFQLESSSPPGRKAHPRNAVRDLYVFAALSRVDADGGSLFDAANALMAEHGKRLRWPGDGETLRQRYYAIKRKGITPAMQMVFRIVTEKSKPE